MGKGERIHEGEDGWIWIGRERMDGRSIHPLMFGETWKVG